MQNNFVKTLALTKYFDIINSTANSRGESKMKTIHEILSEAFREIKEQHGVALESVDFNPVITVSGDARHGFIKAETVVLPKRDATND